MVESRDRGEEGGIAEGWGGSEVRTVTVRNECRAAARKVLIGRRLWMNHKVKSAAGGSGVRLKTRRHDESRRRGARQRKERKNKD